MTLQETSTNKVKVVTMSIVFEFEDLTHAKTRFPDLDSYRGSRNFTSAVDYGDGFLTFESWEIHNSYDEN